MQFKVNLTLDGLKDWEVEKVKAAADKIERVFNSDEFRMWCVNYSWNKKTCSGILWKRKCRVEIIPTFHDNEGLSNYEVYTTLMSGKERLKPDLDSTADINLKVDRSSRRGVIGYTYPKSKWQWVYGWVLNTYDVDQVAGNLIHEWTHKAGFSHSPNKTDEREHSIPYAVGYYVRDFI